MYNFRENWFPTPAVSLKKKDVHVLNSVWFNLMLRPTFCTKVEHKRSCMIWYNGMQKTFE